MREADLQALLLRRLNAPHSGVRVWRQNAGQLVTTRGTMRGAPRGAADLCGLVEPEGFHLEVEVKGRRTKHTDAQKSWGKMLGRMGGIYVVARVQPQLSDEENVEHALDAVQLAVAVRRARGCA